MEFAYYDEDESRNQRLQRAIELGIWAVVLLLAFSRFINLGIGDLKDWDECLYAWRAKIIYFRGDWLDQSDLAWERFYSAAFPPLQVWVTALLFHAFGISEFTARFWPALTGAGAVIVLFLMGRRLGRNWWSGLFAALFLSSVWYFTIYSRMAQFDVPFTFWIILSLYGYIGYLDSLQTVAPRHVEMRREGWWWLVLSGTALGLGLMNKIALALMAPIVAGGISLYCVLRARHPLRRVVIEQAVINGVAFVIILPWHLAMRLSPHGQEFWDTYFRYHLLGRSQEVLDEHTGPWFFYFQELWNRLPAPLTAIGLVALGWFAIGIVVSFRKRSEGRDGWSDEDAVFDSPLRFWDTRYVIPLLWLGFQLALFSVSKTKRDTYTIPMYPAIALLAGTYLGERLRDRRRIGLLSITVFVLMTLVILSRMRSFGRRLEYVLQHLETLGEHLGVFLQLGLLIASVGLVTLVIYLAFRAWPTGFHRALIVLIIFVSTVFSLREARKVLNPDRAKRSFGWQEIRRFVDDLDDYDCLIFCGSYMHPGARYYLNGLLPPERSWHPRVKCIPMMEYDAKVIGSIEEAEEVRVILMKSWLDEHWSPEERSDILARLVLLDEGADLAIYRLKRL